MQHGSAGPSAVSGNRSVHDYVNHVFHLLYVWKDMKIAPMALKLVRPQSHYLIGTAFAFPQDRLSSIFDEMTIL